MIDSTSDYITESTGTKSLANLTKQRRDAIIFIPGLCRSYLDQSVDCISGKITNALARQTREVNVNYVTGDASESEYMPGQKARKRTIVRRRLEEVRPFLDVYELNYEDDLTKHYKDRNPILQALALLLTLTTGFFRLPRLLIGRGKKANEKLQVLYSVSILGIIASYVVILILAALSTIPIFVGKLTLSEQKAQSSTNNRLVADKSEGNSVHVPKSGGERAAEPVTASAQTGNAASNPKGSLMDFFRNAIVLLTGLGLFKSKPLKEYIKTIAVDYTCAIDYLSLSERKRAILGKLSLLEAHIREAKPFHGKIHIISYSFGSLIAIDALYPYGYSHQSYEGVFSVVTIGCPFDLVRNCWPKYFTERMNPGNSERKWINLYNPIDVLGSNFRNDDKTDEAEIGIEVQADQGTTNVLPTNVVLEEGPHLNGLSIMNLFAMRGIRMHASYWNPEDLGEISCFDEIIKRLYLDI